MSIDMDRIKITISVATIISVILISLFTVRNSVIRNQYWKVTSGADLNHDFLLFSEDSVYSYNCPIIREGNDIIAIALFQFDGRLIVLSTKNMYISFMIAI